MRNTIGLVTQFYFCLSFSLYVHLYGDVQEKYLDGATIVMYFWVLLFMTSI